MSVHIGKKNLTRGVRYFLLGTRLAKFLTEIYDPEGEIFLSYIVSSEWVRAPDCGPAFRYARMFDRYM